MTTNPTTTKLQTALSTLNPTYIDIHDDSASHAGHAGNTGGSHYNVTIVSEDFDGLSLIKRHRLVYEAAGELMTKSIHALSIQAKTPTEFSQ